MINKIELTDDAFGIFDTDLDGSQYIEFFDQWAEASRVSTTNSCGNTRRDAQLSLHDYDILLFGGAKHLQTYNDMIYACLEHYVERYSYLKSLLLQSIYVKVQKTNRSEGFHSWHCENTDASTLRRVLATTVYLNDIDEGGETEFLYQSRRVRPKAGRVVIWPAGFPYVHRGNPPLSGSKYILTSWLELK